MTPHSEKKSEKVFCGYCRQKDCSFCNKKSECCEKCDHIPRGQKDVLCFSCPCHTTNKESGWEKLWDELCKQLVHPEPANIMYHGKSFIKEVESKALQKGRAEERERQFELLLSSIPSNAENLSTLGPEQAYQTIKNYLKKNPWNSPQT